MKEYKQVILVRQDLKLPKGKLCSQVGHACVEALFRSDKNVIKEWRDQGMPKIVLKVKDEQELLKFNQKAKDNRLVTALIIDAGKTTLEPGTKTCVGIGPDISEKINALVIDLKLL
ncbi:peptidyl-tRNA hydrolase Pth2 [Candidatus Woesearchaeota archaeon]|nr:peptidyl-tRNA hydrolase Pth2 [Candidatus Woesearchaeota archaeon]